MFDWTNPYIQKFAVSLFFQLIRNSTIKHTTCAISLSSLDMKHCFAVIAFLACLANADVYLHNPRGSNNRCDEKNNNANNNNRIFDSQNNAQGGYPITQSGQMEVFEGTVLPLRWATQHGCNTANEECTVIVQAMCANDLTDGTPQGNGGNTCTQTRPENQAQIRENDQFAMHESAEFYAKCKERERNPNLFTADQNLKGKDSRFTRQNPKGKRSGFECPTERDYFPTWIPNPFFDIAVLTSNTDRCGLYQAKSQNVDPKGECSNPRANDPARCAELGGTWNLAPLPLNISAPDCIRAQASNQNRLGDIAAGNMSSYDWLVPQGLVPAGQDSTKCVLRVRYNITSADAPFNFTAADNNRLKKNPVVNLGNGVNMRFAVNTAQVARTFEDRSFVFNVRKRPAELAAATIHSVTVMGRRGNIAQIGPNSIEYEFAPRKLAAKPGDVINFQFLGSNFDPQNNDGEGKKGTSRSNLICWS
ncbi:hypothetical protein BKA69DRAFT_924599 [Paraphysoderma sedebokerense]|nr:hypothetical protein BKA69DRAFT_924599 [Paraphysoderma sedebokerense]